MGDTPGKQRDSDAITGDGGSVPLPSPGNWPGLMSGNAKGDMMTARSLEPMAVWHTKNGRIEVEWNFTNLTVFLNDRMAGGYLKPDAAMALVNELAGEVVWSI